MWISTGELQKLIYPYYPASKRDVLAWCEEGTIPEPYAIRKLGHGPGNTHWKISQNGVKHLVTKVLGFNPEQIVDIQSKCKLNFNSLGLVV